MAAADTIRIDPGVLRWVMDNEGWEVDELAREANLDAPQLRRWVSSESDISIGDIQKMSDKFRRPMSTLFMAKAPTTTIPPQYRRSRGAGQAEPRMSRDMLNVIREARFVQDNAAELMREMGRGADPDVTPAKIEQSAEAEAARSASILGIGPPRRTGSGDEGGAERYGDIRAKIESRNVFVMRDATPVGDDASGLTLADPAPAVVLVNSNDPIRRRIFTLLHGYAHVLLCADGVCHAGPELDDRNGGGGSLPHVERWCNRFASAVLMPGGEFRAALDGMGRVDGGNGPLRAASALSDRFCVSRTAALLRAIDVLEDSELKSKYVRCCQLEWGEGAAPGVEDDEGFGATDNHSQAALCMMRKGRKYARLVSDAEEAGMITTSTMLEYLGIKLDCLAELVIQCGDD